MKFSGTLFHKKKIAKVARPILEVMLSRLSVEEIREKLREAVRKTDGGSNWMQNLLRIEYEKRNLPTPLAYTNIYTGNIRFFEGCSYSHYAHELIHKLRDEFSNDNVIANAISSYMQAMVSKFHDISKLANQVDFESEEAKQLLNPTQVNRKSFLDSLIGINEYTTQANIKGYAHGVKAAGIELAVQKTGVGLFYLREINEGVSVNLAQKRVVKGYEEIDEFGSRYGQIWNDILHREADYIMAQINLGEKH